MKRHGILVAVTPSGLPAALEALANTLPLIATHTVTHATHLLQQKSFCLIVGTLQFDDSRLFELLPIARETGTPIIATKLHHSVLSQDYIASTFRLANVMGFNACVDVQALERKMRRKAAFEALREIVMKTAKKECE